MSTLVTGSANLPKRSASRHLLEATAEDIRFALGGSGEPDFEACSILAQRPLDAAKGLRRLRPRVGSVDRPALRVGGVVPATKTRLPTGTARE